MNAAAVFSSSLHFLIGKEPVPFCLLEDAGGLECGSLEKANRTPHPALPRERDIQSTEKPAMFFITTQAEVSFFLNCVNYCLRLHL